MHDGLDNDPLCDEHEQPAAADGDAQRVRGQDLRHGLQLGRKHGNHFCAGLQ